MIRGRRAMLLPLDPADLVLLARGGLWEIAPLVPPDATCVGGWWEVPSYRATLAVHSNAYPLVERGGLLSYVDYGQWARQLERALPVLGEEPAIGLTPQDLIGEHEPAICARCGLPIAGLVYRFHPHCV